jgi:hypothetical protein
MTWFVTFFDDLAGHLGPIPPAFQKLILSKFAELYFTEWNCLFGGTPFAAFTIFYLVLNRD